MGRPKGVSCHSNPDARLREPSYLPRAYKAQQASPWKLKPLAVRDPSRSPGGKAGLYRGFTAGRQDPRRKRRGPCVLEPIQRDRTALIARIQPKGFGAHLFLPTP